MSLCPNDSRACRAPIQAGTRAAGWGRPLLGLLSSVGFLGSATPGSRIPHPPTLSPAREGGQNLALRRVSRTAQGEGGRGVRTSSASGRHPPKTLHLKVLGLQATISQLPNPQRIGLVLPDFVASVEPPPPPVPPTLWGGLKGGGTEDHWQAARLPDWYTPSRFSVATERSCHNRQP